MQTKSAISSRCAFLLVNYRTPATVKCLVAKEMVYRVFAVMTLSPASKSNTTWKFFLIWVQ